MSGDEVGRPTNRNTPASPQFVKQDELASNFRLADRFVKDKHLKVDADVSAIRPLFRLQALRTENLQL